MNAPRDRERFLLLLRDADANDPDAGPAVNRLKRTLKCLLRNFGLRSDRAEIHPGAPAKPLAAVLGEGTKLTEDHPR